MEQCSSQYPPPMPEFVEDPAGEMALPLEQAGSMFVVPAWEEFARDVHFNPLAGPKAFSSGGGGLI